VQKTLIRTKQQMASHGKIPRTISACRRTTTTTTTTELRNAWQLARESHDTSLLLFFFFDLTPMIHGPMSLMQRLPAAVPPAISYSSGLKRNSIWCLCLGKNDPDILDDVRSQLTKGECQRRVGMPFSRPVAQSRHHARSFLEKNLLWWMRVLQLQHLKQSM
jgi:hypothetical protein